MGLLNEIVADAAVTTDPVVVQQWMDESDIGTSNWYTAETFFRPSRVQTSPKLQRSSAMMERQNQPDLSMPLQRIIFLKLFALINVLLTILDKYDYTIVSDL